MPEPTRRPTLRPNQAPTAPETYRAAPYLVDTLTSIIEWDDTDLPPEKKLFMIRQAATSGLQRALGTDPPPSVVSVNGITPLHLQAQRMADALQRIAARARGQRRIGKERPSDLERCVNEVYDLADRALWITPRVDG